LECETINAGLNLIMEELLTYRQELLSTLEADVTLLTRIEANVSSQGWYRRPSDDQPTAHYTLARLWADDAHGFTPQICRILDEEMPKLLDFDGEAWMVDHYDSEVPARVMIEDFASLRTWEVDMLCGLAPVSWSRAARHPRWGVHTLQWWVEQQRENSHQHLSRLTTIQGM
jgi:hypothetical protein